MSRYRASIITEQEVLKVLALEKEYCQYDLPKKVRRDYHTVLRHLKRLRKMNYIDLTRTEPSAKGGKERKIYAITLEGLIHALSGPKSDIWNRIDEIASMHSEKLLVFQKWNYFKEKGLREIIIRNCKIALSAKVFARWTLLHLAPSFLDVRRFYREQKTSDFKTIVDSDVLGVQLLLWGAKNPQLVDVWKVCKEDPDLRAFMDSSFSSIMNLEREYLQAVEAGKEYWDNL